MLSVQNYDYDDMYTRCVSRMKSPHKEILCSNKIKTEYDPDYTHTF